MTIANPKSCGVPHAAWRPNQFRAYTNVVSLDSQGGGITFQELPTGSGKSAVATALGSKGKVTALVQNLGLLKQYERMYGFSIVMGRQEYPCVLKTKVDTWKRSYGSVPTAADCHFKDMNNCPDADSCPYMVARNAALQANLMACTYKYAALSDQVRARQGFLVLDEAHVSVAEILSLASFTMDESTRQSFELPEFPRVDYGNNGDGDILDAEAKNDVIAWVAKSINKVSVVDLFDSMSPTGSKTARMFETLNGLFNLLIANDVFYKCTAKSWQDNDWRSYQRSNVLTMTIKTLTADNMARKLFANKRTVLLMSATIGNPGAIASELGIPGNYQFNTYPHPIQPDSRPIYRLDIPKMTKANLDADPSLYKQQAQKIAQFVNSLDKSWRGIVLTTSNYKIGLLRRFLSQMLFGRILLPPSQTSSVSERVNYFMENKQPGKIAVDTIQGWGTGIDLRGDIARFAIVAGIPYSNPADRFEAIRMDTESGRRYSIWSAHSATQQAAGRVTRGEKNEDGTWMLNVAALADGSQTTKQAYSQYSTWFKEAIRDYK